MKSLKIKGFIVSFVALISLAMTAVTVLASEEAGYGGDAPACTIHATPDTIKVNGGTTLIWNVSENVTSAYLHPKGSTDWMQEVPLNGWWWISGIVDSRDYTLTVTSEDGQTADCDAHITVEEGMSEELSCNMYADPATIAENGGTNLIWSSTGDVVSAYLHPTGSEHSFANVSPNGSWWISGITNTRSYSVTLTDSEGNTVTCDAPITVEEEEDTVAECYDWDGDGWGWDGEKGCRMPS